MSKLETILFLDNHRDILNLKQLSSDIAVHDSTGLAAVKGTRTMGDGLYFKIKKRLEELKEELCLL